MLFTFSSIHHIQKKSLAFTLAEVMIALGVIGIAAALTIPTVYNTCENHINLTKFNNMYAKLTVANSLMVNQDQISWHPDYRFNNVTYANGILKYFSVTQTCSTGAEGVCWPSQSYYLSGAPVPASPTASAYVLNDGTFISFTRAGNVCSFPAIFDCDGNSSVMEVISIDVNGFKGPNMWGGDQFFFLGSATQLNPGYTIGGGRECGYNIIRGQSINGGLAAGGKRWNPVNIGGVSYNKCGY